MSGPPASRYSPISVKMSAVSCEICMSSSDAPASSGNAEDDAYYAQFVVPDDLVW